MLHAIETSPTADLEHKQYFILQELKTAAPFKLFLRIPFLYVHLAKKKYLLLFTDLESCSLSIG